MKLSVNDVDAQAMHAAKALGAHAGIFVAIHDDGITCGVASRSGLTPLEAAAILRACADEMEHGHVTEVERTPDKLTRS